VIKVFYVARRITGGNASSCFWGKEDRCP